MAQLRSLRGWVYAETCGQDANPGGHCGCQRLSAGIKADPGIEGLALASATEAPHGPPPCKGL